MSYIVDTLAWCGVTALASTSIPASVGLHHWIRFALRHWGFL